MGTAFKDYYDRSAAELIAQRIGAVHPGFPSDIFIDAAASDLDELAFGARQDQFAAALEVAFGENYVASLEILGACLGEPLAEAEGMFTHGWWLWPIGRYVERNATRDREASLAFCHELTRRFTGEFALRPLLREWPEWALAALESWAHEDDVHVRRCASESIRISLPWASKLLVAVEYPQQWRAVLDPLKADPEKFVQKSVGNNMNDLMKLEPDLAWRIINDWRESATGDVPPATEWIIRHGTRSLRKKRGTS